MKQCSLVGLDTDWPHGWAKAERTSEGEMKAVFTVGGDGEFPAPNYDIAVMFNGVPGTVILEIEETSYSGGSNEPTTSQKRCIMRSPLKSSQARALASAILSAATETKA